MKIFNAIGSFFKMLYSAVFGSKTEKVRNKNLLKKGGYSIALIAIVLVGAVVFNLLVGLLADRVNLEFDLTTDKKNSMSRENREYIQKVDKEVNIYILASSAEEYYGGYMQYYAQQMGYSSETSDYYKQTASLLEKYSKYNDKITVTYLDPFGTEMSEISTLYPNSYSYGDILVTCKFTAQNGNVMNRHKLLTLVDIYSFGDLSGGASMGMDYYYITDSCLETSLTSAIASVTSEETKKVAFISGRGGDTAFEYYRELLGLNNFIVEDIDSQVISEISSDYDGIIICSPTSDFMGSELDVISDFLKNDGKLGKTLLYFADSGYQNLPNIYNFLSEWGIDIGEGIVFETDSDWHQTNSYSTLISQSAQTGNEIIESGAIYLSGYNVPMQENGNAYAGRSTKVLLKTSATAVNMPMGSAEDTAPDESLPKKSFATCILSTEEGYIDTELVTSNVLAFSSVDFISEYYATSYASYCDYKDMSLRAMQVPTGMNALEIVFENKTIASTSQLYLTNDSVSRGMLIFFSLILPLLVVGYSIFVFIRRRNL